MKAKLLAALAAAVSYVRKLPVAQYLKPIWKGALKEIVIQEGGDKVQAECNALLDKHAAEGIDAALAKIDAALQGLRRRFADLVRKVPCLPAAYEEKATEAVDRAVTGLLERLAAAAEIGRASGVGAARAAFNASFDSFQDELKGRIDAIN